MVAATKMIIWAILASAAVGPRLTADRVEAVPHRLNELRVAREPPADFEKAFERWTVLSGEIDGRTYENNSVFVYTGAAETRGRILWEITWVNWDARKFQSETRVYIVQFGRPPPGPDPNPPGPDPDRTLIRATYVYERTQQTVPRAIQAGLTKLNQKGVQATAIDQHVQDGTGDVPDQYKIAIQAAADAGIPVLVLEYSDGSVKTVKNPTTIPE